MTFNLVQRELDNQHFRIVDKDYKRQWGGFFVIAEGQAQCNTPLNSDRRVS